jgi:hypothetical protein
MARTQQSDRYYDILGGKVKLEAEDTARFIKYIIRQTADRIKFWVDDLGFPSNNGATKQEMIADYLAGMVKRDKGYWIHAFRNYLRWGNKNKSWKWTQDFGEVNPLRSTLIYLTKLRQEKRQKLLTMVDKIWKDDLRAIQDQQGLINSKLVCT